MKGNNRAISSKESNSNSRSNILRESSFDFGQRNAESGDGGSGQEGFDFMQHGASPEDPPSKLIGQFLHKQKASGEISLDIDLEMDELQHKAGNSPESAASSVTNITGTKATPALPTVSESPNAHRVAFESLKRRHSNSTNGSFQNAPQKDSEGDVVKCSSNKAFESNTSFNKKSNLLMTKTKSRLMDPPPERVEPRVVGRSGLQRSGFMGTNVDDDEEDPLLEEDLPDEYKKEKNSIWVILEWFSLILIIGALVCSLTIPYFRGKRLWKLELWKWYVMVLVLMCGRLVSSWIIRIIVFCIERNFYLRKRVLYFVYGVRKAVQNCLWLGLVLIAWHYLFDERVERETNSKALRVFTKILICLLVSVILWLVKTLLVKVLASSFHMSTYFDRIQEALFNQYVIETLSGPPVMEIHKAEEEEERIASEIQTLQQAGAIIPPGLKGSVLSSPKSPKVIGSGRLQKTPRGEKSPKLSRASSKKEEGITIDHLHKLNPKNVSAWNMKRLMNTIRHGSLTTLDEQIQGSTQEDESAPHIRSEYEAKAVARKIYQNVAQPGSKFVYLEDLMRFLTEDEALKTMSLFEEASESKKISKSALKNWVVNVYRERRALAFTLNDTKTAVNKLHQFVNILVGIIIVIIWLVILGIATSKFLLVVSSQLVVVAFIFGNSCKTVFEAIIFLFVMHPFDVGDRCEIDGVQMIVEEMNILTTVFLRFDNQKIVFPNSVLATKPISNYNRSPDMGDAIEFCVHLSTPAEKIAQMKQRILSYIENKKDHWCPNPMIIFKDVEGLNMVRFAIWPSHRMNHQDMGERWARRSLLIDEMSKIFRELDMEYRLFPINVNVRGMPQPGPPMASDRLSPNWTPPSR